MKKISSIVIFLLLIFFLIFPVNATSGCCSSHGGVNCGAGAQGNGNVICNDGWTGSSCSYSSMVMCGGSSGGSVSGVNTEPEKPVYVPPTKVVYIPPSNTPRPLPTWTPLPTKKPTVTNTPAPTLTPIPTLTPKPSNTPIPSITPKRTVTLTLIPTIKIKKQETLHLLVEEESNNQPQGLIEWLLFIFRK